MPAEVITSATIWNHAQADAQYMRSILQWARQRYQSWNQNVPNLAFLTGLGLSTADGNAILAMMGDMNRIQQLLTSTLPGTACDVNYDTTAVLGLV